MLGEEKESIHALLRYCNDCMHEFIKALHSVGAHVVTTGDSISGPSVVSPAVYREYSFPYEFDMAGRCKKLGIPFSIHICGHTDPILETWVETGAEIFEIDHKTTFAKARRPHVGKGDPAGQPRLFPGDVPWHAADGRGKGPRGHPRVHARGRVHSQARGVFWAAARPWKTCRPWPIAPGSTVFTVHSVVLS